MELHKWHNEEAGSVIDNLTENRLKSSMSLAHQKSVKVFSNTSTLLLKHHLLLQVGRCIELVMCAYDL